MGWPELLVLVRHAESEGNVLSSDERGGLATPSHRYGLTERGRKQAAITGAYLRETYPEGFHLYYNSHYLRVQETMRIMCPNPKIEIYEDPRLAEGNRGIWSDMTEADIRKYYPAEFDRKQKQGFYDYRPIGGENWPDVELRIHSFIGTLSRDAEGKKVLVAVHGFWFFLFRRLVERFSVQEARERWSTENVENASVSVYKGNAYFGLERVQLNFVPWQDKL
ncbi:histidine phosphatase family protein [Candidatus Uhrbacteria bacterium]|nr:histidine phosphatase family protein [Candidatus Uhrbacteria bacterium]